VLFIPGNPGVVDFYIPFLSAIYEKLISTNVAILARAHLDHSPQILEHSRLPPSHGLTIQIESSIEILDSILCNYAKTRIVVIGHSVGAWISLQLLKARSNQVTAVFLLFPTISYIGDTPNGKKLTPLFKPLPRYILSSLSRLAKYLPSYVFRMLFPSWPEQQVLVLRAFIGSSTAVHSSLAMANEEMKSIKDLDIDVIEHYQDKLRFFHAEQDDWVGEERERLLGLLDLVRVAHPSRFIIAPAGVPHVFCISHYELVANQCHDWLLSLKIF